jgi:hypothetical protein
VTDGELGLDESRRTGLRRAKLTALIRSRWQDADPAPTSGIGAPGPALRDSEGDRGWVLVDPSIPGALGGSLIWGLRHALSELHLVVDEGASPGRGDPDAGVLARRAGCFRQPSLVQVWRWAPDERQLHAVSPTPPATAAEVADPGRERWADLMRAHGIDPLVEHGVLIGEVLGLEVARLGSDVDVADGDEPGLAIGVGHHDRTARSQMRPGQSVADGLDEVVALVRRWRAPGAERHPANTLARERWLRSLVMGRPALVGARWLDPLPALLPRGDLRRAVPAAAAGVGDDGRAVVAVCSTGVDLDVVPVAADYRLSVGVEARLVIVVPAGDDVRVTRELIDALVEPAEVRTVPRDWPTVLGA